MLLYCIMDTNASAALLNQPAAVAIARRLAAADSEVGRLRLLLRVHASLIKVRCSADKLFCIRHIHTQADPAMVLWECIMRCCSSCHPVWLCLGVY
jgi:hypothetical protein